MMDSGRILDEVTRVSIKILLKEPFYSHIFACLNKEVVGQDHRLKTLAVGLRDFNHVIFINEHFWDNILVKPEHRYGVVKHEILHIVLKHTLVNTKSKDSHIANIAMDIVVNQYVHRDNLPDNSIFLSTFPELHLDPDKSWEYYYRELMKLKLNRNQMFSNTEALRNLEGIEDDSHGLERHIFWDEFDEMTTSNQVLTENILDNLLIHGQNKTSSSSYGKLPGRIQTALNQLTIKEVPLVNWKKVLKLFSESSAKTRIKNTLKRQSKRFGTFPGIKVRKLKKILVAVDTSGSVADDDIAEFFGEIFHIWRNGAEIRVVECDSEIAKIYDYKGKAPQFVHGRGGTDFNAPIVYANDTYNPDALVYFTDGYAPIPRVKSRNPMLWIFTKDGIQPDKFSDFPGRKAKF